MAFVAVDKNGTEYIYPIMPNKSNSFWYIGGSSDCIMLPQGTIKKLIGFDLKWEDEPVELT